MDINPQPHLLRLIHGAEEGCSVSPMLLRRLLPYHQLVDLGVRPKEVHSKYELSKDSNNNLLLHLNADRENFKARHLNLNLL